MRHPRPPLLLLLAAVLLSLAQCHQSDPDPATPESQLPPATQTGANSFGCLVNGQVWKPSGNNGTSNYSVYYDPTYRKGTLNIGTYRYALSDNNYLEAITIFSDSLKATGTYPLTIPNYQEGFFMGTKDSVHFTKMAANTAGAV